MLPPNYLLNRVEDVTLLYNDLHTSILESIAQHIAETLKATGKADVIPSTAYQVERLNASGMLREDIIKRIAEISKISRPEIRKMFQEAAIKTRVYDDRIYQAAGLEPIPVMQSPALLAILEAGLNKTLGSIERLTGTIATNAEERFNELLNLGYNKVSSGAFSYREAIADAVDDLSGEGVTAFNYASGRKISIEAAVRMNVLTGVNQTAGEITKQTMTDLGVSLVRTSAHLGARNKGEGFVNHEVWQEKVFLWRQLPLSKAALPYTEAYPDFVESCGYGHVQGIQGANCRHSFGPYIEGLSPETYTVADLDKFASETVTYKDWKTGKEKTVSFYQGTQIQRGLERRIRKWKRRQRITEAAGLDATSEKIKVREWQLVVKVYTEQTGLKRDYIRERIAES